MDDKVSLDDKPEAFDPHYHWLGIPPYVRPITLYRLLGLRDGEHNTDVIANAADRQMAFVRQYASGPKGKAATKLLNEISQARVILLDPKKKAEYDQQFRREEPTITQRPPAPGTPANHNIIDVPPVVSEITPIPAQNSTGPVEGVNIPPRTMPEISALLADTSSNSGSNPSLIAQPVDPGEICIPSVPSSLDMTVAPPPPPPMSQPELHAPHDEDIEQDKLKPGNDFLTSLVSQTATCPRCKTRVAVESQEVEESIRCPQCHLTIDSIEPSAMKSQFARLLGVTSSIKNGAVKAYRRFRKKE